MTLGGDISATLLNTMGLTETDDSQTAFVICYFVRREMTDLELRNFFDFDEGDLAANRAGRLSPKQQEKINETEKGASQIFFWAGVILVLVGLGSSYGILKPALEFGYEITGLSDLIGPFVGLAVTWGVVGFFAVGAFRLSKSKFDSSVQSVEGKVNFVKVEKEEWSQSTDEVRSSRTVEEYELRVGRIAFEDVDEELLNIIEEGDTYAFYYTKDTKDILSCEFISKGK